MFIFSDMPLTVRKQTDDAIRFIYRTTKIITFLDLLYKSGNIFFTFHELYVRKILSLQNTILSKFINFI